MVGRGNLRLKSRLVLPVAVGFMAALLPVSAGDYDGAVGHGGASTTNADVMGLQVSEIDSMEIAGTNPTHLQVWVDVTNLGREPATNLTGQMRGAEPAIVLGEEKYAQGGSVGRGGTATETFEVIPRTIMTVDAFITSNSPLGSIGLVVTAPDGHEYPGASGGDRVSVQVPKSDVDAGAFGEWSATVSHDSGLRSISFLLSRSFKYTEVTDNISLAELPAGETYRFYYNIWADEPDTTIPPAMTITVNGTVVEGGVESRVSYIARVGAPVEQVSVGTTMTPGGGDIGAAAAAVVVVIAVGAIGAYALVGRGWRPAQLLRLLKRQPPAPPAAPPPQNQG